MQSTSLRDGNSLVILARVTGMAGADIVAANIGTLSWQLVRQSDKSNVQALVGLTPISTYVVALATWTFPDDSTFEYNFIHRINGSFFNQPGVSYIASYKFVDTDSFPYWLDHEIVIEGNK